MRKAIRVLAIVILHAAAIFAMIVVVASADEWGPGGNDPRGVLHYVVSTLRPLLWPALLAGRLGLVHTWVVLPFVVFAIVFAARHLGRAVDRKWPGLPRALPLSTPSLLFAVLGWVYVFAFPVPTPVFPPQDMVLDPGANRLAYYETYEEGYRRGITGARIWFCGFYPRVDNAGRWAGYAAGAAEWEAVLPGITKSAISQDLETSLAHLAGPPKSQ